MDYLLYSVRALDVFKKLYRIPKHSGKMCSAHFVTPPGPTVIKPEKILKYLDIQFSIISNNIGKFMISV